MTLQGLEVVQCKAGACEALSVDMAYWIFPKKSVHNVALKSHQCMEYFDNEQHSSKKTLMLLETCISIIHSDTHDKKLRTCRKVQFNAWWHKVDMFSAIKSALSALNEHLYLKLFGNPIQGLQPCVTHSNNAIISEWSSSWSGSTVALIR